MLYDVLNRWISHLDNKDLEKYKRKEIIEQRKVLDEIHKLSKELRKTLAAEKQRRFRSKLRTEAQNIRKERRLQALKAKKKKLHNPYYK